MFQCFKTYHETIIDVIHRDFLPTRPLLMGRPSLGVQLQSQAGSVPQRPTAHRKHSRASCLLELEDACASSPALLGAQAHPLLSLLSDFFTGCLGLLTISTSSLGIVDPCLPWKSSGAVLLPGQTREEHRDPTPSTRLSIPSAFTFFPLSSNSRKKSS